MKKFKIFTLIILAIILFLTVLSFIKLPLKILTNERIQKETGNLLSINSFEKQSLLILPKPNIEIINSVFSFNSSFFSADIEIPSLKISRSLLDNRKIDIQFIKANLQKIRTDLITNEILLEDEIANFEMNIKNLDGLIEIETNDFKYRGADISFNAYLNSGSLEKLSFSIKKLEIDELVLLLDERYLKYINKLNFSHLDIKGEYSQNSLIIEKLELNLQDGTKISLLGLIDLENIINSDLNISGNKILSENLIQFLKNLDLKFNLSSIPEGVLNNFNFNYEKGSISDIEFSYKSNLGTDFSVIGDINILGKNDDSNLNIKINSNSSKEITKIINSIKFFELPVTQFQNFEFDSDLKNGVLVINSLKLINVDTIAEINGEIEINDFENRNLKISLNNFDNFDLLPSSKLTNLLKMINPDSIDVEFFLSSSNLEIINLDVNVTPASILNITGDLYLQNSKKNMLDVNFKNINSNLVKRIFEFLDQPDYKKYIEIIDFEEMQGNILLDFSKNLIVINKLELLQQNNISGVLSGEISNKQFKGLTNIQNINLNKIDQKFFKTDRFNGILNIDLGIPNLVDQNNFLGINGSLEGEISFDISDDEIALLMFVQSLSHGIEDFNQVNELAIKLSRSFVNKNIFLTGEIINNIENKIFIKNIELSAPNGDVLLGEFEYYNENFKITLFDIIDDEDLIIKFENNSYSYERVVQDGSIRKPIEELIQKNIGKLFENLFQ